MEVSNSVPMSFRCNATFLSNACVFHCSHCLPHCSRHFVLELTGANTVANSYISHSIANGDSTDLQVCCMYPGQPSPHSRQGCPVVRSKWEEAGDLLEGVSVPLCVLKKNRMFNQIYTTQKV